MAKAIALSLSHPFGAGNSYFRIGSKKLRWVDTVFGGCYKREIFEKVGLWNEDLLRGSDMDFHKRLKKVGGKILLVPDIIAYYYPKSTFSAFAEHNYDDGFWTFFVLKAGSKIFCWRHMVPLAFLFCLGVLSVLAPFWEEFRLLLMGTGGIYVLFNLAASSHIAIRKRSWMYLLMVPIAFAVRHIAYGMGSLVGLCAALTPGRWPRMRNT